LVLPFEELTERKIAGEISSHFLVSVFGREGMSNGSRNKAFPVRSMAFDCAVAIASSKPDDMQDHHLAWGNYRL
jgi:hypothetical protein